MDDSHFSNGEFPADDCRSGSPQADGRDAHRLRGLFRRGIGLAPDLSPRSSENADQDSVDETFDTITRFFEGDGWHVAIDKAGRKLRMGVTSNNGKYSCAAFVQNDHVVVFLCILPINAPPDKRHTAAEFVTRANYGLAIGNFEMDFSDGEIRFKASIDIEGGKLTTRMVRSLLRAAVVTTDRHFPELMNVLWNGCSPASAVARVRSEMCI